MTETTYGILLAGGLARRMGGGDKALRHISGTSMLAHVIAAMRPQCAGLLVNANGDPARFADFGLPVVADDIPGFAGPLAGLLAGLDWLVAHRPDATYAVSVPTDTPFLPNDLVARLQAARKAAGAELACATSGGVAHPVVGIWPVALRTVLRTALVEADIRKVNRFTAGFRLATADWSVDPVDPFLNANTPDDIALATTFLNAPVRNTAQD